MSVRRQLSTQSTQSSKKSVRPEETLLTKLLEDNGFELTTGNIANILHVDKSKFQISLSRALRTHPQHPEVVTECIEGLIAHMERPFRRKWCLLQTESSPLCKEARADTQESLIRILLNNDDFQTPLIVHLLEKLAEISLEQPETVEGEENINFSRLILSQLRWLHKVKNSREVLEKLLEILTVVNAGVQHDLILALPDIVGDAEHGFLAKQLGEIFQENRELTVPILDTLSNLAMDPDTLAEIHEVVLKSLESVDLESLPTVVRFVLQSVGCGGGVAQTLADIRFHLDLSVPTSQSSAGKGAELLTIESLRCALRFNKTIYTEWFKLIESLPQQEHKPLDLVVVFLLHSLDINRKQVETLLRNKAKKIHFTSALVEQTYATHQSILRELFPSILALAEIAFHAADPAVAQLGALLYTCSFRSFDRCCQQEVVGNLVSHVGSGVTQEIDLSLDTLLLLLRDHPAAMAPFGVFLKSMLDFLHFLTLPHIRKLYQLLTQMAFQDSLESRRMLQDDLHLLIRKQLTNPSLKFQRMGVLGALMAIQVLSHNPRPTPRASSLSSQSRSSSAGLSGNPAAIALLNLVIQTTSGSPHSLALFYDELSLMINKKDLDSSLEKWVTETITDKFQEDFVVDIDGKTNISPPDSLECEVKFGLDNIEDGVGLNLYPLMKKNRSLVTLAPHFRLLRVCEQCQHGPLLEGIDAMLGAPVLLPAFHYHDELSELEYQSRLDICSSLFYCLNWFRELVNGFCLVPSPEMQKKVISRLKSVVELEERLRTMVAELGSFTPPPAVFDYTVLHPLSSGHSKKSSGSKKGSKKKKKEEEEDDTSQPESTFPQAVAKKSKSSPASSTPKEAIELKPEYLRELDLDVFTLLKCGQTSSQGSPELETPELLFLLADLHKKVSSTLLQSARPHFLAKSSKMESNSSFSALYSPADVARYLGSLLPTLCHLLEDASAFFQTLTDENDGLEDGPGTDTEESQRVHRAMMLELRIVASFFSWHSLSSHPQILRKSLAALASRLDPSLSEESPQESLVAQSMDYLSKFGSWVRTLAGGVALVRAMESLAALHPNSRHSSLATLALGFLQRDWSELGPRQQANDHIHSLLRCYLRHVESDLQALEDLASQGIPQLEESLSSSTTFPTLSRNTLATFYRVMFGRLVDIVRSYRDNDEDMDRWSSAIKTFHNLVHIVRNFNSKPNLATCLKNGAHFVDTFLRHGMPLLDRTFSAHHGRVQEMLRSLQLSTRFLQHVCSHSKVTRDLSLVNHIPLLKKTLETFVYRVKAMLALNQCQEAFWIGNLKNRDLHGDEILSQATAQDNEEDDDDDNGEDQKVKYSL